MPDNPTKPAEASKAPSKDKKEEKESSSSASKKVIEVNIGIIAAAIAALVLMPIVTYVIVVRAVKVRTETQEVSTKSEPVNFSMPSLVVNIAETKGTRFLKATITFSLENPATSAEVEAKKAQITDILISLCSSRSLDELEQSMGREQLKKDIIARINPLLDHGRILNVFFSEFVIQ